MLIIRKFKKGDEVDLRKIFFNTIRKVNIKDYSEHQVKAWAPGDYDQLAWYNRMSAINPFVAILDNKIVGLPIFKMMAILTIFFAIGIIKVKVLVKL